MISTLTEEAVNAACLGFDHRSIKPRGTSESGDEHPALLSLNIEEPQNTDWLFHLASGSWKRICMNLVLNALKYTPCGYVGVSLRKKWLQKRVGRGQAALVELVVSCWDTHHQRTALTVFIRSKIPASECRTNFKSRIFSAPLSKRTNWLLGQGLCVARVRR